MAKLVCELADAYSLSTDPQAIELHQSGIVQIDGDARPESVEVIGFSIGRHGYWHNRAVRQIKGPADGMDRGQDIACLRSGRSCEVIRRRLLVRGPQLIDMSQGQNNTRWPARKLLARPGAIVIEGLAVGAARGLRC